MRITTALYRLTALAACAALLNACSSTPKTGDLSSTQPAAVPAAKPDPRTVNTVVAPNSADGELASGVLAKRSVYFDFDNYAIKPEFNPMVEAHAKYLTHNKARKIVIQGNADERGGSEYNLALGQKRAEAVRRALKVLGEPEAQMETVSFGKEKPRALGHDEASWAQNRRADIVYLPK